MSRRLIAVDVLHEVRRALRILRRAERSMVQERAHAKRTAEKARDRAELKAIAAAARQARAS